MNKLDNKQYKDSNKDTLSLNADLNTLTWNNAGIISLSTANNKLKQTTEKGTTGTIEDPTWGTEGGKNPTETNPTWTTLETMLNQKLGPRNTRPILESLRKSEDPKIWETVITMFEGVVNEGKEGPLQNAIYTIYDRYGPKKVTNPLDETREAYHNSPAIVIQAMKDCEQALKNNDNKGFKQALEHFENVIWISGSEEEQQALKNLEETLKEIQEKGLTPEYVANRLWKPIYNRHKKNPVSLAYQCKKRYIPCTVNNDGTITIESTTWPADSTIIEKAFLEEYKKHTTIPTFFKEKKSDQ